MRQAISQYTDIRDELEDFRDFIQDICCDIGGVVEEIDEQLDLLCDRLITYNKLAEKHVSLSSAHPSAVSDPTAGEKFPFPPGDDEEAL